MGTLDSCSGLLPPAVFDELSDGDRPSTHDDDVIGE
jgi:hypothetical protein